MTINLGCGSTRLSANSKEKPFVDASGIIYGYGIAIDLYPRNSYIELRKKSGYLRLFVTQGKSWIEEEDLEYWRDAEIVFSINNAEGAEIGGK